MSDARKKSPRAPSLTLEDALERAVAMYEKERRHEISLDVAAQDIGYKNSKSGAAVAALASLRYFGLIERVRDGVVAVSKDVETFKFAPEESARRDLKLKWLKTPPIFSDLLEKYSETLPSDAAIKFELIQRGFLPASADECLAVFRKSVDFAGHFDGADLNPGPNDPVDDDGERPVEAASASTRTPATAPPPAGVDRIPVRLTGNRKAWLEIPSPFFARDKEQLVAQIGLLLTDDEEDE